MDMESIRFLGSTVLRFIRGLFGFIGGWQVFTLLPILSYLTSAGPVPDGVIVVFFVKFAILIVCAAVFFGLRPVVNKMFPPDPRGLVALPKLFSL